MAKRKRKRNGLAPTAKFSWQAPDWDLANEIGGIPESQRINEHRPPFTSLAKTIRLSKLSAESTCLGSDELNPETILMACEGNDGDKEVLTVADLEECFGFVAGLAQCESFPPHLQAELHVLSDPAKPKKHKKILRRIAPQLQQETAPTKKPTLPDIPTTAFAGNNLVPVRPRNVHGCTYKKDERASGIRSQELFLSSRCCGGKKNPNFRKHRLIVIRNKKRGLAA